MRHEKSRTALSFYTEGTQTVPEYDLRSITTWAASPWEQEGFRLLCCDGCILVQTYPPQEAFLWPASHREI